MINLQFTYENSWAELDYYCSEVVNRIIYKSIIIIVVVKWSCLNHFLQHHPPPPTYNKCNISEEHKKNIIFLTPRLRAINVFLVIIHLKKSPHQHSYCSELYSHIYTWPKQIKYCTYLKWQKFCKWLNYWNVTSIAP